MPVRPPLRERGASTPALAGPFVERFTHGEGPERRNTVGRVPVERRAGRGLLLSVPPRRVRAGAAHLRGAVGRGAAPDPGGTARPSMRRLGVRSDRRVRRRARRPAPGP